MRDRLAFYNEIDPFAADWLEQLIAAGSICPGVVDRRDIRDILPSYLDGFSEVHFFAGIGGWSYALRLAEWPDDRPVWTGSCPCQPFSAAGKGGGFADERHLWPSFHWLIQQCRPAVVMGEQVASKDRLAWFDLVHADMEATGYAIRAIDFCSAGVGAPHIRQRLIFGAIDMADADDARLEGRRRVSERRDERAVGPRGVAWRGVAWRGWHHGTRRERRTGRTAVRTKRAGHVQRMRHWQVGRHRRAGMAKAAAW